MNRRKFFSDLWNPARKRHRPEAEREARVRYLEAQVFTEMLPGDFELLDEERAQLASRVRALLEASSDRELFSIGVMARLETLVRDAVAPWREAAEAQAAARPDAESLREIALGCARPFLNDAPTDVIQRLKERFGVDTFEGLEAQLREEIAAWIEAMDPAVRERHSARSLRESVFAHLETWC